MAPPHCQADAPGPLLRVEIGGWRTSGLIFYQSATLQRRGLDWTAYRTHSMRRTKAALINQKAKKPAPGSAAAWSWHARIAASGLLRASVV
jgi:hypothetical protein